MIKQMKYPGYFLIVWDFIRYAREQGIPVGPGRGSAAGSLVAYCLRITDVDPIDFDLIFERFLNPERVSLPDIDIDFCERRRGEVIDYVTRKYGRENVAQIITFGTMKAKAVVRDVGRVLEMPFADVDKVAKLIPPTLDMTLDKALEESPALKELEQNDPKVKELLNVARRLEGMTRHASVHAAGVVIAPKAITEYAPLYKGARDEITTQWSMKEIERIGLLKMDFLGLSTLTLIYDAIAEIARTTGETLDIDHVPLDDAKTYQVFQDGATYGIFQFESSGMRDILRKAKPQRLEDLIALNALYRPGPLRSGMVDDFIARKQGKTEVKYELPQLEPILAETYGVIAYQEQVMRISNVVAGFTLGEADLLRKAMGKKNAEVMAKMRGKFVDGLEEARDAREEGRAPVRPDGALRGVRLQQVALDGVRVPRVPDRVPEGELPVALRGRAAHDRGAEHRQARAVPRRVPRSRHSGAAAGRQRKRAPLHGHPGGRPLRADGHQERRRGRDRVAAGRPPREGPDHVARRRSARISISGCSTSACSRAWRKPARSIRWPAASPDIRAKCGRGWSRPSTSRASTARACSAIGTKGRRSCLAGETTDETPTADGRLPEAAAVERDRAARVREGNARLVLERPSGRSLPRRSEGVRRPVDRRAGRGADDAPRADSWGPGGPKPIEPDTSVGGIVAACRPLKTRKGDSMAVFTLEDAQGGVEVIVFPEAFQRSAGLIETGTLVLVRGKLERDDESMRLLASEILPLDSLRERLDARGRDSCQDASRSRDVRGAGRGVFPAPGRSARLVRNRSTLGSRSRCVSARTSRTRSVCAPRRR